MRVLNQLVYLARHPVRVVNNINFRVPEENSSRRHYFIIGVPRSGTTLLKILLAAHPEIGGSDYESTGIFGIRDIFEYAMGELTPEQIKAELDASADIIQFYDRIADCLLARTKKRIFVDKLQVRSYRLAYVKKHFPQSVFIHIVRDGRDCYCSALNHPNVRQAESLTRFARYWRSTVSLPAQILPPERLYTFKYEDLTSNPQATLESLMAFLGLSFSHEQIEVKHFSKMTSIKKREVHENLAQPITARSQGRWRSELTVEEVKQFNHIAGEELTAFGYSLE